MPVRKRVVVEDDDEGSPSGSPITSNKRARTVPDATETNRGQRKQKARAADDENMEADEDGEEINAVRETSQERAEKDKEFEAKYYEKILASVKSREKISEVSLPVVNFLNGTLLTM